MDRMDVAREVDYQASGLCLLPKSRSKRLNAD